VKEEFTMNTTIENAVARTVDELIRDFESRDIEAILSHYSSSPTLSIFGTGADERAVGKDQLRAGFEHDMAQSGDVRFDVTWQLVGGSGSVAWVAAEITFNVEVPGRGEISFPARFTAVLQDYDGRWLIEQSHLSAPAANQSF
jgi:ketosteroid isomerase-like protein